MGNGACQSRKCHDKDAGADRCFQFVAKNRCQDQKHHHAAAGTDKAADKSDHHTADDRLDRTFFGRNALHGFLGGHDRTHDKFDTE